MAWKTAPALQKKPIELSVFTMIQKHIDDMTRTDKRFVTIRYKQSRIDNKE